MDELVDAFEGLATYDLLGPFSVVEALQRLERIACAAAAMELSWEDMQCLAQEIMATRWENDGLPDALLAPRRAEVLLRLDVMLEQIQRQRQFDLKASLRVSKSLEEK